MHLFKEEKAMNKIKRFLAGSLAVMMAASVMTACGKD